MEVTPIPMLGDNYCYMIVDPDTKQAAIVDPVEPQKVLPKLQAAGATEFKVLTTHKHADHSGGNEAIHRQHPEVAIYGGKDDSIPAVTHPVSENDVIQIGSLKCTVLDAPCHTSGHVLYYVTGPSGPGAVFTGDTVFIGGCGRFFEGTAQMMLAAMAKVAALPPDTKMYCGHEYTVKNLTFAEAVDGGNRAVVEKLAWAKSTTPPTVPSTIGEELTYNPFMRATAPELQAAMGTPGDPIACMAALRARKDKF